MSRTLIGSPFRCNDKATALFVFCQVVIPLNSEIRTVDSMENEPCLEIASTTRHSTTGWTISAKNGEGDAPVKTVEVRATHLYKTLPYHRISIAAHILVHVAVAIGVPAAVLAAGLLPNGTG